MGDGHTSDGAVSGGAGSAVKGVDVVLDVVDYNAAHFGFRWGLAAQTEIHDQTCQGAREELTTASEFNSCRDGLKHNPYGGTMYTKLALGPIHFGTQATFKNLATTKTTAVMNTRSIVGGLAAVFGDTLSLSYGVGYDKYRYNDRTRGLPQQMVAQAAAANECNYDDKNRDMCREIRGGDEHEYITTKYRGFSAALNIGPVALKGTRNHVDSNEKVGTYVHDNTHTEFNLSIAF
jgi:hypothetical protein